MSRDDFGESLGDDIDVEETVAIADEILERVPELPERAADFAESVDEKAASIKQTIQNSNHVTPAQRRALENMLSGVKRWIR